MITVFTSTIASWLACGLWPKDPLNDYKRARAFNLFNDLPELPARAGRSCWQPCLASWSRRRCPQAAHMQEIPRYPALRHQLSDDPAFARAADPDGGAAPICSVRARPRPRSNPTIPSPGARSRSNVAAACGSGKNSALPRQVLKTPGLSLRLGFHP